MPTRSLTLTEQQQAVVDHPLGPALVFAVVGAGKTTSMVHRIERLVLEGVFARGDRRLSQVIEAAWAAGARFDSWTEHARPP